MATLGSIYTNSLDAITANAATADYEKLGYMATAIENATDQAGDTAAYSDAKQAVVDACSAMAATTTDGKVIAYLMAATVKLGTSLSKWFWIGEQGKYGFGMGAIPDDMMPDGFVKVSGHDDYLSDNYGHVIDAKGSHMGFVPRYYYKENADNTTDISPYAKTGYVIEGAFLEGGTVRNGFFIDLGACGNHNGEFVYYPGIAPCSTSADNNPISALTCAAPNRYGGIYKAVASRGTGYNTPSLMQYNALARLAKAHGEAAESIAECAFSDTLPHLPKGNNNNALGDTNDGSVHFTSSEYSNCALSGSGIPYAKTTHNGQPSGIADLNGNMWEAASGFIKTNDTDAIFKVIKSSVVLSSIVDDSTTQGGGGAYDVYLYDDLDLTGIIGDGISSKYGNGSEAVFEMSIDTASDAYKRTCLGIPLATGKSPSGSTSFGNDFFYEKWKNELAPRVGGNWSNNSSSGVFAIYLDSYRDGSYSSVGGRASFYI